MTDVVTKFNHRDGHHYYETKSSFTKLINFVLLVQCEETRLIKSLFI